MEQETSTPTVELNHEHIYHLRRATKGTITEREIATVHSNYLAKNYEEDDEGRALVDDLELDVVGLDFVRMGLSAVKDSIPIDIWTHLYETFDHQHQVTVHQPGREDDVVIYGEDVEFIDHSADTDDSDDSDDIIVTDGGVDTVQSKPTPGVVGDLMGLGQNDHVAFQVHSEVYSGTVSSRRWTTTEGRPGSAGYEVVTAHVQLESPSATPFENELISLHAARPRDGDWPDDEPVVIDTMDVDFGELENLQISENDELWRCGYCEKTSYEPDTSRPIRGQQSMEMRVTCPHCGKTDLVEWQ